LLLWSLVYWQLEPLSIWLTHGLLCLPPDQHAAKAFQFFVFESPKVMMLLAIVVFGVGIIRSFFTPERTRRMLAGRRESAGNILAALLGIVTPFCSCSAVPLFIGFVTSGVPLGVTFSFLVSSPMVNEVALALLFGLFGWKVAAIYLGTGLSIAIVSGWVIGRLKMESHVEDWGYETKTGDAVPEMEPDWHAHPSRQRRGKGHCRPRMGLCVDRHRRRRWYSRLCSGRLHGLHHGQGCVVGGAVGGPHRHTNAFR